MSEKPKLPPAVQGVLNDTFLLCASLVLSEPMVTPRQMRLIGRIMKRLVPLKATLPVPKKRRQRGG